MVFLWSLHQYTEWRIVARIPFTSSGPPDLESSDSGEGKEEDLPEELIEEASYLFIYLFIYFWLCWVFVSVWGLSLVAENGGHSSLRCAGLSLSQPLLLRSTGSRRAGSVIVAHEPSCSAACGIFPDQGSNPCPLHWQADSQPLRHQGSPRKHHNKPFSSSKRRPRLTCVA